MSRYLSITSHPLGSHTECDCWFLLFWFLCLQAPAWNSITKAFAGNDKVSFGDVNLAEEQIRKGNPGEGGWPTVRYFNKETGYEGKSYTQKTSKAMCDELGDENYMQAYVEEAGGVLLCSTFDCLCARREGGACSKKEIDYYEKNRGTDVKAKLKLLSASLEKATKKDEWMSQRISILKLIDATATSEGTKQEL